MFLVGFAQVASWANPGDSHFLHVSLDSLAVYIPVVLFQENGYPPGAKKRVGRVNLVDESLDRQLLP